MASSRRPATSAVSRSPPRGIVPAVGKVPQTRDELLLEAQEMCASGVDQAEIIERFYRIAARFNIRVRHDQHDPHSVAIPPPAEAIPGAAATAAKAATAKAATTASETNKHARRKAKKQSLPVTLVRQKDGSHKLNIGDAIDCAEDQTLPPARDVTVARVVLSNNKHGGVRGGDSSIYYESNGLVIDARTWRALAIPPNAFNHRPSAKNVNSHLASNLYDIIRVDDGTVVTLYCWTHPVDGPVWALASSNAYDVSSLRWIGNLTYAEIFYDLAHRLYPSFETETGMTLEKTESGTSRLNFTNLDRTKCYTVGIRHHNFHPVKSDPERMWQIQSADLSGPTPRVVFSGNGHGLPGIPDQKIYPNVESLVGDNGQLTMERLRSFGEKAIANAADYSRRFAAGEVPAQPENSLPEELNYGYILRSRDPGVTKENSDILIETPLLSRIRKIIYEKAPCSINEGLSFADRLEYNALRAFLTSNMRSEFLALCPDWAGKYKLYNEFVENVIKHIIHAMRQTALAPASHEPSLKSPTGQVARGILEHLIENEHLAPFDQNTESIVRDFVVNPEYSYLFLRAMQNSEQK